MGLFSFGKQSSSQQSQSSSFDAAINAALSQSFSEGGSQSTGAGQSTSTQSIAFADLFAKLFGGASNAAASASAEVPALQDTAARLFSGGTSFLEQLSGGAGQDYLTSRVAGPDQAANASLDELQKGLGRLFSESLLPAITSRGVATGTLGGSREGVQIAQAAGEVADRYSTGAADILSRSQEARDAAASSLAGYEQGGAATGLEALPQLFGLAQSGAGASLSPYLALSQIFGGPTVLTQGQSTQESQASSFDIARAISESFGLSAGGSQSTSTAKSKGFSFGFSPIAGVS